MKNKLLIFLLIICVFVINIEVLVLSVRIDRNNYKIKACDEDLKQKTIVITELADTVDEEEKLRAALQDDYDDTSEELSEAIKEISSLTDALEKVSEEKTTESVTEEKTTEKQKTENKVETTTQTTTEETTAEKTTTEKSSSGNAYGISLTDNDIYYLQRMAETETFGADMISKTHVISVALNRCIKYGKSPYSIITAPNQFAYSRTSISQTTKEAVNYVLQNGDTAQGALFFHSGGYTATFQGRPCIFGDDVGHYFY